MSKIYSLQWLRAIAALWVLLTHVLQLLGKQPFGYTLSGQYGVDVFFVLSGFIIYHTTKEGTRAPHFLLKRIFRIFPAYLLCLFLYAMYGVMMNGCSYSCVAMIQNILMMPCSGAVSTHSLIVGQAWSTCYEMYFYLVFAIVLLCGVRNNKLPLILCVLFAIFYIVGRSGVRDIGFVQYICSLAGRTHVFKFIIGIVLAMAYDKILSRNILNITKSVKYACFGGGDFVGSFLAPL